MKRILLLFIAAGLCLQARSESLSTIDGATYNNISAKRVDPDGLYIEYSLPGGGFGSSKVKFSRLSAEQQKQFGYDAAKARDFEARVAKAQEDFRQEAIRSDQIALAQRLANQRQDGQQLQILNDRVAALEQMNDQSAAQPDYAGGAWYPGYGYPLPRIAYILGARNAFRNRKDRPHITNPAFITTKRLANKLGS